MILQILQRLNIKKKKNPLLSHCLWTVFNLQHPTLNYNVLMS